MAEAPEMGVAIGRGRVDNAPVEHLDTRFRPAVTGRGSCRLVLLRVVLFVLVCWTSSGAQEPLRFQVDRAVETAASALVAPLIDDAAFARRASLVLTGTIPEGDDLQAFLADSGQGKRETLVEALGSSPAFPHHLAEQFDVLLMERRPEKHAKQDPWRHYLVDSFRQGKTLDVLTREILGADGGKTPPDPAIRFLLDRDADPHRLTRDMGRVFLGIDVQCAQCHDHPRIEDYTQRDYYGLHAFFGRTFLFQPDLNQPGTLAERGEGESAFQSVFTEHASVTGPRLPGLPELVEQEVPLGEEYTVAPDPANAKVRPAPRASRRSLLADALIVGASEQFARNWANRLWAMVMGHGLVEPVDLHHSGNPPSNPELLELLAAALREGGYDVRPFVRELVLTKTFQRAVEPGPSAAEASALLDLAKAEAEERAAAAEQAKGAWKEARTTLEARETEGKPVTDQWEAASAALREAVKQRNAAAAARDQADGAAAGQRELGELLAKAAGSASQAAQALPELGALGEAAAQLQGRSTQAQEAIAAAQKAVDEAAANLNAKEQERQTTEGKRQEIQPQNAEMRNTVAEARRAYLEAESRRRLADLRLAAARKRVERLSIIEQLETARTTHAAAAAKLERTADARSETAAAASELDKIAAEQGQLSGTLAEQLTALQTNVAQLSGRVETLRLALPAVQQAVADATAAQERLPEDAAVQSAAQRLRAAAQQVDRELLDARERLTAGEASGREMQESIRAAEAAARAAADGIAGLRESTAEWEAAETAARSELESSESAMATRESEFLARQEELFAVGALTPLTPEQLCRSMMQATGALAAQRSAAGAEYDAAHPAPPEGHSPASAMEREAAVEASVREKIRGAEAEFVRLFGGGAGQPQGDFFATVDQALYFSNGGTVQSWLAPANGNLTDRLVKMQDSVALAEELYLCVLSRQPSNEEEAEVGTYLQQRGEARSEAVQELCWALLGSTEFRFHH